MDFLLPEIGEGLYEAELTDWRIKPGDKVKRGQTLMEILTDKATMEVPSPFAGTITELKAKPGQKIKVGEAMLAFSESGSPVAEPAISKPKTALPKESVKHPSRSAGNGQSQAGVPVKAAPSVRLMARKLGIDLAKVHGTGPEGRILIEDLTTHVSALSQEPKAPASRPHFGTPGTRIPLVGLRRKIAEHMTRSRQVIPEYSYVDECDVTDLVHLRTSLREPAARAGLKLTYMAFLVKAVVEALKEVPLANASLNEEAGEIVLHDRYHVGIAVATPAGLIVPVVHDADQLDLWQIAREIERLGADARAGKSRLEDLKGGTFTITSIGNIGGLFSTPVINHPEVGILGVGKIVKRPVFNAQGQIRPADLMYLSFAFDHRVVDGAVGTAFGNVVIRCLQAPAALLVPAAPRGATPAD